MRLLLKYPAVLKTQLRAFLRVSGDHPVGILLPGVGSVEEIRISFNICWQADREDEVWSPTTNPSIQRSCTSYVR